MMKYSVNKKNGLCIATFESYGSNAITNVNIVVDSDITKLRKRVGNLIKQKIKSLRPDEGGVGWKTSIGDFNIYKETDYDDYDILKSKYKYIKQILEIVPKNGDIKHRTLNEKKLVNPDYGGLEECPVCNKETLLECQVIRQGEKLMVCKACKKFDDLLEKISKKIDAEKKDGK